jgi:RNA polymerase sigma-70 factor (ECF subfamily)
VDKGQFKILFDEHYRPLCNFAFRITGDLDKSEDIVQDVFVKIWNQNDLLKANKNIRSFIYTMVRNHALEVIRRDGIGMKVTQHLIHLHSDESEQQVPDEDI